MKPVLFLKAHVHGHVRRTKTGAVWVSDYQNKVQARVKRADLNEVMGDLFDDSATETEVRPGSGPEKGRNRALPEKPGRQDDPVGVPNRWEALARRGAISQRVADGLAYREEDQAWPEAFADRLAGAIEQLPPAVREWLDIRTGFEALHSYGSSIPASVPVIYRKDLSSVPPELHATYESAAAVTVNHMRIEFFADKFPDQETLRHELVHLAWNDIMGRWGDGPAVKVAQEASEQAAEFGEALLKRAHKADLRAKAGPKSKDAVLYDAIRQAWQGLSHGNGYFKHGDQMIWDDQFYADLRAGKDPDYLPEHVRAEIQAAREYDPGEAGDPWLMMDARWLRSELSHMRARVKKEKYGKADLSSSLELNLVLPRDYKALAKSAGVKRPGEQYATIGVFLGCRNRVGKDKVYIRPEYEIEEPAAYRAGEEPEYAERLFAAVNGELRRTLASRERDREDRLRRSRDE